ncbi:MAG: hypothetical protein ABI945_06320 [Nitrospirales bacterium]
MKSQIWFPLGMVLMMALYIGCSGSDSSPGPSLSPSPNLGGALATDRLTPASDELTGEESGLMSAGDSEPESRQQRPPG